MADQDTEQRADPLDADDVLPSVEPPSPGFILQLFVVPGAIVVVIVLIWLLFTWLATAGSNPRRYFHDLSRTGPGRWQAASSLADVLRGPRYAEFKQDREAAGELAGILAEQLDSGKMENGLATLQVFLCRALGEFYVDDGLEVLLRAARLHQHPLQREFLPELDSTADRSKLSKEVANYMAETDIRLAAIEGIALLSINVKEAEPPGQLDGSSHSETFGELVKDKNRLVRSTTAFALGVMEIEPASEWLENMLEDINADVRYNAATGLARRGNAKSIGVLLEMLDPDQQAGSDLEKQESLRIRKQTLVIVNGLRAVRQLLKENSGADAEQLLGAINRLKQSDLPKQITLEAIQTELKIRELQSASAMAH